MVGSCVIVFDLDDTLYLEKDFARSGFCAASRWLEAAGIAVGLDKCCQRLFDSGEQSFIFDNALMALNLGDKPDLVAQLVEIYRNHEPQIDLAEDAARYLNERQPEQRFGMITDGPAATQSAKVRALKINKAIEKIVYTGTWGEAFNKPHPRAFEAIEDWCGVPPEQLVYIGDNPKKDFVTPKTRGWWTVQMVRPGRVHLAAAPDDLHTAHASIETLDHLDDCLVKLAPALAQES